MVRPLRVQDLYGAMPNLRPEQNIGVGQIALFLSAAFVLAAAALYAVPRASESLATLDDPQRIASRAIEGKFDAAVAQREIEEALAARDSELAQSLVDLAQARNVNVDPAQARRVALAVSESATAGHKVKNFARGFVTGAVDDGASLAGTAVGDLFLFGDIRDAVREGTKFVKGENPDELVLGLAGLGIAITAGTYATMGAAAPARVGVTLAKVARRTGNIGSDLLAGLGRMVRQVDFREPALAARSVRSGAKVSRVDGLLQFARDLGQIEKSAGARTAIDSLKIAKNPRDIGRIAKLAEKEGSRTRAILKIAGRAAIAAAFFAVDASLWLLSAVIAIFGFISALKGATERAALRFFRRRRERRRRFVASTLQPQT
ncbi:MAG TPA: hypothetical protein VFP60_15845 [Pseudolabrys sp.]|nr:hypothetical protein [Pseudolabrys sp.]